MTGLKYVAASFFFCVSLFAFNACDDDSGGGGLSVPRNGLIGEWLFSGNMNDTNPTLPADNGTSADAAGTPTLCADRFGNPDSAYSFDGVDDRIQTNGSDEFTEPTFTLSLWVKPGATQKDYADIVDCAHSTDLSWVIQMEGSSTNVYGWAGLVIDLSARADAWVHIVCISDETGDPDIKKVYVDNVLVDSNNDTFPAISGWFAFGDKTEYIHYNRQFNGCIDDIRYYNRALSAREVSALYNE